MRAWLKRLFCRHAALSLSTLGAALIVKDRVELPAVEVRCEACGEFWHARLDASEAMMRALGSR